MARTPSNMMPLGTMAPDFELPDTISGKKLKLQDIKGEKGTLVMFICNHCPFVLHVIDELVKIGREYKDRGIGFVAISSNDVVNYPDDSPEKMSMLAGEKDFPFPYLYDESQDTAKDYQAACTPDFFLFDSKLQCVYRGQLDDSRPSNGIPVSGTDMRNALNALVEGSLPDPEQKPSIGCNIKWKNS